jgi:murein DD-endopeptidase MepM/ murein hydrolase activator NlpD
LRFAQDIAQGDEDLATSVAVQSERLRRERERLTEQADAQAKAAAALKPSGRRGRATRRSAVDRERAVPAFQDEQAQAQIGLPSQGGGGGSFPVTGSGPSPCPVAGPVSFVDSFGWPRPGGRTHEGIDMSRRYGTPIVAVHSGNAVQTPNSLGGTP